MDSVYNLYCDESCHLENDGNDIMVLGSVWCPKNKVKEITERIKEIKIRNGILPLTELKWSKLSNARKTAYLDIVNYFFDNDGLHFRGLIVKNKDSLRHEVFKQTHDDWYYKMYFNMLKIIFSPKDKYDIYLDIKDTNSYYKIDKLHEALCNNMYDFSQSIIRKIQTVRSHEVQIIQMTDIFAGALAYKARGLNKVAAKTELIDLIKERSGYSLGKNTLYRENKFNIFYLSLQEKNDENM